MESDTIQQTPIGLCQIHQTQFIGQWGEGKVLDLWCTTTRFIVDSYHYNNHSAKDTLCNTWCNPAPTDGSAPNLVIMARDKKGNPYFL